MISRKIMLGGLLKAMVMLMMLVSSYASRAQATKVDTAWKQIEDVVVLPTGIKIIYLGRGTGRLVPQGGAIFGYFGHENCKGEVYSPMDRTKPPQEFTYNPKDSLYPEVVQKLRIGDRVMLSIPPELIITDSLQLAEVKSRLGGCYVFRVEVDEVYDSLEVKAVRLERENEQKEKTNKMRRADSVKLVRYIASNKIQADKYEGGYYKELLRQGTGPKAEKGDSMGISYKLLLLNGYVVYDNTYNKRHLIATVGGGKYIASWEESLYGLQKGEKFKIYEPDQYGFSRDGNGLKEGEMEKLGTNLVFEIEVVELYKVPAKKEASETSKKKGGAKTGGKTKKKK